MRLAIVLSVLVAGDELSAFSQLRHHEYWSVQR